MPLRLQHECNLDDPSEAFVWAFVSLPGPRNGPLLVPQPVLEKWSKHLWELGFRHHPDLQTLEYQPPPTPEAHWLNPTGVWVPKGTATAPAATVPDISQMTVAQRHELIRQLQQSGELAHPVDRRDDQPDQARVGTAPEISPPADGDGR
ncbi:phage gene 29 protein family protein [Nocardia transvalensis]|uniref:phage gene 29 protein family protein n=1 Tax=Nocardia transvalensis TaxID=37333 RepID=UPI001893467C|nr:DUF2744 domain-containing protein [Nocardia transvalensis]MBF6332368.1 DUF2744 domain-containing protein [Nocardia transvalensis]